MIIEKWDGLSFWDELKELSSIIDLTEGITESSFEDKMVVLYASLKATLFLLLSDGKSKCFGYFTVKDYGNCTAFVTDYVTSPEYVYCTGRWARKVLCYILDTLGFKEVKCRVNSKNKKAIRLWSWLGFNQDSINLSIKKKKEDSKA